MLLAPKPPVPIEIKCGVTSTILVHKDRDIGVNREPMKYDTASKLLSYFAIAYGVKILVSEQPTSESFIDIPKTFDKVAANMNEYAKFDSNTGTVHLMRPEELAGKQTAVMNSKGTLMFVKPDRDLSEDQWNKLFSKLEVIK